MFQSHQKIRKSGRFEVSVTFLLLLSKIIRMKNINFWQLFYWTHFLYVPFFILLLIHARNAWKWLVVPLLLYAFEVINRTISIYFGRGKTDITLINTLPNDVGTDVQIIHQIIIRENYEKNSCLQVVHLRIRRPDDFEYQCGDWLFINIPQVAKYEWHAFTISSEPEALGNF